jgi:hypothetical protein
MAQPMRDNPESGGARKVLHNRLEREAMGDEAYKKYVAPSDWVVKVGLLLLVVVFGAIVFTLN